MNRTHHSKRPLKKPNGHVLGRSNSKQFQVDQPEELLAFLLKAMSRLGRNSVKSILKRGQVAVNGTPVTAHNHPLRVSDNVTVSLERTVEAPPLAGLSILFEDDDIIIVNKEAGLLSVASPQEPEVTAYRQLMAHVRAAGPDRRVFIVHRLDRDTSGVMMFAKSEEVQQALQNAWRDAVEERTYVALVEGKVKREEGTVTSWLKETKTLKMYSSSRQGDGLYAVTHYKTLRTAHDYSLLEVRLETGRKNQIRVHMEDLGHPIAGDKKYGARSNPIGRLGLHARVLAFTHPTTGESMRFETDIPKLFLRPFRDPATR